MLKTIEANTSPRPAVRAPTYLALAAFVVVAFAMTFCVRKGWGESVDLDPTEGIVISSFYGKYDPTTKEPGRPATSLAGPQTERWIWNSTQPGDRDRPLHLGVLFPNHEGNDPYWRTVRKGIVLQSQVLGIDVEICASRGYEAISQHQQQFMELLDRGVDGILLGSIHYLAMDDLVAAAGIPVIEIINDVHAPHITAKALVSFRDMGARAAEFVFSHAAATHKKELTFAFFPGPINSGWAPESLKGFLEVARTFPGELIALPPAWGSPEGPIQRALLEKVLDAHQHIDYLIGNAVAAHEAIDLLEAMGRGMEVTIVSTYYSDAIRGAIVRGEITAAPTDGTEHIGRLAVTMMSRFLNGESPGSDFPFRAGPRVPLVTAANVETLFPQNASTLSNGTASNFARDGCSFDLKPSSLATKE
jgi:protein TorT